MSAAIRARSSHSNAFALIAICLAGLMFGLEISSVPIILPDLERVLGADFKALQWIMNAYTIACTTVLMATGTLADRFGRRRVFVVSTVAFGLTSLLCGLAPDTHWLIVGRFLQGMAGGAILICSIAVLSHQFPEGKARGRAFAIWGIVSGIGLGFGPAIGSAVLAVLDWRWIFLVHVPLAALGIVLTYGAVQESRDPHAGSLDLLGILTLTAAVLGLTYAITQGADLGIFSPIILGVAAATLASMVAFVLVEKFHPHPMFDFSVFKIRDFSGAILGCVGMNFSYWPFMIYLPLYFSAALGYDNTTTGLLLLAYTLPYLVMPPIAQYLLLRYQARVVIPAGLFAIGLGFLLMRLGSGFGQGSGLAVLPGALVAGIGLGLTTTPVTNMTTGSVPANRAGMASGMDISARLITLAINIAVMGAILVAGIRASLRESFGTAFDAAQLRAIAERLAGGDLAAVRQEFARLATLDASGDIVRAALADGFGGVMLYGGIGVWAIAALSAVTFSRRRAVAEGSDCGSQAGACASDGG
ncbi:MAG TPA: MFS transporter [Luteimonas sp.]|nr:MFS transporter [Luteimonas sp.]